MKSWIFAPVVLCFLVAATGCSNNQTVKNPFAQANVAQAPPAVVAGFHQEFPGFAITHVTRLTNMGANSLYRIRFRDAKNVLQEKTFGSDGTMIDTAWGVNMPKTVAKK